MGGEPVTIDVTNTSIGAYHFDNRNTRPGNALSRVDDNYGEHLDRLNIQAGWWRFRAGVRIDSALYFNVPSNTKLRQLAAADAADLKALGIDPGSLNDRANDYYRELNTRFVPTYYPSKLFATYMQKGIEATVGDFYAQLGRGLVFSVRKIDELAIDTTIRGGKVVVDRRFGDLQAGATVFAGQLNPLRIDEASGRRLNGGNSPLFFAFPRARDFQYYAITSADGQAQSVVDPARPNYLEDTVYGGHVELGGTVAKLGANVSVLSRKSFTESYLACSRVCSPSDTNCQSRCASEFPDFSQTDASRLHNLIQTFSGTLSIPSIAKTADAYVEIAGQRLKNGHVTEIDATGVASSREPDISGYAVYANVNVRKGPVTLSLEGKHYRRFFPLSANIDLVTPGFRGAEYSVLGYNQVPTAEPIYVEQLGSPNVCMTGGRARGDYRFSPHVLAYGWVGRYSSRTEINPTNNLCDRAYDNATGKERAQTAQELAENTSNTWDTAVGSEILFDRGRSHSFAWIGARLTDREVAAVSPVAGETSTFYREGYIRYDVVKHLAGPYSLQVQGFHRHRYQPQEFGEPWNEGENYTALQWSPHFAGIVGYEYLAKTGCRPRADADSPDIKICHFMSGGLQWRSAQPNSAIERLFDTVNLFIGQRRGAIRCVSGVCRQFPPFEGARIEIVSRF